MQNSISPSGPICQSPKGMPLPRKCGINSSIPCHTSQTPSSTLILCTPQARNIIVLLNTSTATCLPMHIRSCWNQTVKPILSMMYFLLAGLCEIDGGYLVWRWLRDGKVLWYGVLGAILLMLYDFVPTAARQFLTHLCRLWWRVHRAFSAVGMAG